VSTYGRRAPTPGGRFRLASATDASICYAERMTAKVLKEAMRRVETWPEEAQAELAEIALEMDVSLKVGAYRATPEELAGIDRGLKAAREGRFATAEEVEAVFAKHRRA